MSKDLIFFNRYFDKNRLKSLILWSLNKSGEKDTLELVEKLKQFGFEYATEAGLSLGIDDLTIPPNKIQSISEAEIQIHFLQTDYQKGNITLVERFQQMIDIWHRTSETLKQNVISNFRLTNPLNPVYMMAFSGARGNISQVRQLVGMRGLMSDPQGQIIDFPIRSNFREGLTLTEYIISCFGARKGLVDTALRTANSGYLTRRLVDVSQHIIVRQLDCGTNRGIYLRNMFDGKKILLSLKNRLVGRVLAEDIESIATRNQDISNFLATKIVSYTDKVLVRSPLTCEAKKSVCQLCYGWSLAHGNLVSLGEAVGILAAQSIGEPGTQLTMRTFHTGGVFSGDVMDEIRAPFDGIIHFPESLQGTLIRTLHGKVAFLTKVQGQFSVKSINENTTLNYKIPILTVLFIRQSEKVLKKQLLAEFSSISITKNQGIQSKYHLNSDIEGEIFFENVTLAVKKGKEGDIIRTAIKFGSLWILSGKIYHSIFSSPIFLKVNDVVDKKSILSQSALVSSFNGKLHSDTLKTKNYKYELTINQIFFQLTIKNIKYKKFSYFFALEDFYREKFFLYTSINQQNKNKKVLKWFPEVFKSLTGGFFYKDLLFLNDDFSQGQFFWIREQNFFINNSSKLLKKLNRFHKFQPKTIKKLPLVKNYKSLKLKKTKQGLYSSLYLMNYGIIYFVPIKNKTNEKQKNQTQKFIIPRTNGRKNPLINFRKKYKNQDFFQIKLKKNRCLKINSINTKPYIHNSVDNEISFKLNQFSLNNNQSQNKEDSIYRISIKTGWCFLLPNKKKLNYINKKLVKPGYKVYDDILFDQNPVYINLLSCEKRNLRNSFFSKKLFLKNKKNRWNFSFVQKKLKSYLEISKIEYFNFLTKNQEDFFISRNKKVFLKGKYKKELILLIKKVNQYSSIQKLNYKIILLRNSRRKNIQPDTKSILFFNKQKLTNLVYPYPGIDFSIIKKFKNSFNEKLNQPVYFFELSIILKIPKKQDFNRNQCIINFPQSLNFIIKRKVKLLNYMLENIKAYKTFQKQKTKNLIINGKNVVINNEFFVTSFFTCYEGEITEIKTDTNKKQKTLLLTNSDKVTLDISTCSNFLKIGQLVRSGDQIAKNKTTSQSGQIIEISKEKMVLRRAKPILFSAKGLFHIYHQDLIEKNTPLITLFYERLKTGDIVQGIPKIEELFEARQTKEGENLSENLHTQLKNFYYSYKKLVNSQEAARKSIEKIQQILVDNVQQVYQSQGVNISDKHIEIIVRQMTTKVRIIEGGRTGLLRGELIDLEWVEIINLGIEAQNQKFERELQIEKAIYEPIILGITKAALETESFISAASFQETTRILGQAAIERKTDFLRGLKENVILGHLIPAGTGFSLSFDPKIKLSRSSMKPSWLNYRDLVKVFSKKS